jgi:uncharacterized protein with beta-barrel porin domain
MKKIAIYLTAAVFVLLSSHSYAIIAPPGGNGGTSVWVLPQDPGGDNNPGGNPPGGPAGVSEDKSISVDPKDMKDVKSIVSYPTKEWSIFATGTGSYNDIGKASDPAHSYSSSEGGQIGAIYHFPTDWSVGLALGYGHIDANFGNIANSATRDAYSPTLFASYSHEGWFADGNFTGAYSTYTQDTVTGTGVAHGATDGGQFGGHLDGGYLFHSGDFTFGPMAGATYSQDSTNSFKQIGAGINDLYYTSSNSSSMLGYLGGVFRYQTKIDSMTVLPYFSLGWQHEFLDTTKTVNGYTIATGTPFTATSAQIDRDAAVIHAGVNAEVADQVTIFFDYGNRVNATYVEQTLNGGVVYSF